MTQAWRMVARAHGGPDVIAREEFDPGDPGEGELLIAQDAVGLNFIDTYYRTGLYPAPLPTPLGSEGVVPASVGQRGRGTSLRSVGACRVFQSATRWAARAGWVPMPVTGSWRQTGW